VKEAMVAGSLERSAAHGAMPKEREDLKMTGLRTT